MRLWFFIWITVSILTLEFVNSEGDSTTTTTITTTTTEGNPTTTTTEGNPTTTTTEGNPTTTTTEGNPTTTTTGGDTSTTTILTTTTVGEIWAEFEIDCDSDPGYCSYNISAPEILSADAGNYTQDEGSFVTASQAAYQINSDFSGSSAFWNYTELVQLFDKTKSDYVLLQAALADTFTNALNIQNLTRQAIDLVNGVGSCYYSSCMGPTSPTSTTITRRPTTTSPICSDHNCTTYDEYPGGDCKPITGQPICTCPGTLDQANDCGPVFCRASGLSLPAGTPGPVWSVGYDGTNAATANYGSNANCLFNVGNGLSPLRVTYNNMNLDPTAKLTINLKTIPLTNVQTFLDIQFNNYTDVKSFQINFKSGTVSGTGFYYDFTIDDKPPK